jgi:hypothetical protein
VAAVVLVVAVVAMAIAVAVVVDAPVAVDAQAAATTVIVTAAKTAVLGSEIETGWTMSTRFLIRI